MSKLVWDQIGERNFETGVEKGVLYPVSNGAYQNGVAWSGLTSVTEKPSGAENSAFYADNIKYLNLMSNEEFGATIGAYYYPDEFAECDGSKELATGVTIGQQKRKSFGLSYVTRLGNDTDGSDHGYKIHIIYSAMASPSERAYATVNESPEPMEFSWEVSTTPVEVLDGNGNAIAKPTACLTVDSTKVDSAKLTQLENMLYGTENSQPSLPLPSAIAAIFA